MISQLIIGCLIASLFWLKGNSWQAISALYGMVSSMSIAGFLGYGIIKAEKTAIEDPKKSMGILYFGAVQRFIMVLGLFIMGMAILKLEPLALALAFGLTQIAYIFNLQKK